MAPRRGYARRAGEVMQQPPLEDKADFFCQIFLDNRKFQDHNNICSL
jgi:hypothetical protein